MTHFHRIQKPQRTPNTYRAIGVACGLLLCATSHLAHASGISAPTVGSGRASPEHIAPSDVYWNPGGLGMIEKPKLVIGGNIIVGSIRYQRNYRGTYQREDSFDFRLPIPPEHVDTAKSGWTENSNNVVFGPQPSFFGAIAIKDTGLVVGFGLAAPYVAQVDYPVDGAQRFSIQSALIFAAEITGSLAYKISEHVSVGAGISAVVGYANINRITDFAGTDLLGDALQGPPVYQNNDFGTDAPTGVRELDVLARPTRLQNMLALSYTFNVGAMLHFDPIRIGFSYHHSTKLNFRGKFRLDMNNDFFTGDLAAQGLNFKPTVRGDASLTFTLPAFVNLGIGYDINERFTLALAVTYTFWSQLHNFDVVLRSEDLAQPELGIPNTAEVKLPRHWHNTIGVDGFFDYRARPDLSFYAHLGFAQNAVPDATVDAASPDADRFIAGLGLSHHFPGRIALAVDATLQHTVSREVTASDYDRANGRYGLTILSFGGRLTIDLGKPSKSEASHSANHADPASAHDVDSQDVETHTRGGDNDVTNAK